MLCARQKSQPTLSAFLKYIPKWHHIERIWVYLYHYTLWRMAANGDGAMPMVNNVTIFGNVCSEALMEAKRGWRYIGDWLHTGWSYSLKPSILWIFNQKASIILSMKFMHSNRKKFSLSISNILILLLYILPSYNSCTTWRWLSLKKTKTVNVS
jgi:hypothetical protein